MRSHLLLTLTFFACSSFLNNNCSEQSNAVKKSFFDFAIHRLSNERVLISWHTVGDSQNVAYEVLRKHTMRETFTSLAVVEPELTRDHMADYSFTDINKFFDSSYYCLKKTNADSVIFYSITKGIEGVSKER